MVQLQPSFLHHVEQQLAPCNGEGGGDGQKLKSIGIPPENGPPQFEMQQLYSYPKDHLSRDAGLRSVFTHQTRLGTRQ